MEIKKAEDKLDQADSFLTKLKTILKKHWGILLLLGFGFGVYWMFTTDFEDESIEEEAYIIEEYEEIQDNGDTLLIERFMMEKKLLQNK